MLCIHYIIALSKFKWFFNNLGKENVARFVEK